MTAKPIITEFKRKHRLDIEPMTIKNDGRSVLNKGSIIGKTRLKNGLVNKFVAVTYVDLEPGESCKCTTSSPVDNGTTTITHFLVKGTREEIPMTGTIKGGLFGPKLI